jgi:hypothetical protein
MTYTELSQLKTQQNKKNIYPKFTLFHDWKNSLLGWSRPLIPKVERKKNYSCFNFSHDDTFMSAVRQVYQLRLHLMNKKAFQQQTVSQMESFPTHTADRDTGEKSRRGDPDTDTNLDSDGNV